MLKFNTNVYYLFFRYFYAKNTFHEKNPSYRFLYFIYKWIRKRNSIHIYIYILFSLCAVSFSPKRNLLSLKISAAGAVLRKVTFSYTPILSKWGEENNLLTSPVFTVGEFKPQWWSTNWISEEKVGVVVVELMEWSSIRSCT